MTWIYLSPHFDDVALSCGGLVWEQVHSGEGVSIWTICGGEPPSDELSPFAQSLHARWQAGHNAPPQRNIEDSKSCQRLGAGYRHFNLPDCIYRRQPQTGEFMYTSEASLNGPIHPGDVQVIDDLQDELRQLLPTGAALVCPLALGNHVDHQLTRLAAEGLGYVLWYYSDFPYVLRDKEQLEQLASKGWENQVFTISSDGLLAWQDSISAHGSQISTFWPSEREMRQEIGNYLLKNEGIRLWKQPTH